MNSCLEVLSKLISYPTITPKDCGIYDFIKSFLPNFEVLEVNVKDVKNLFLFKYFGDRTKKPLHFCFGGHIDVVPPGEGWSSDPFSALITKDYIYGRGVQDMKGGVSAFLCAMSDFLCHAIPKKSLVLSILLTSDE